jgi:hypothetical protein
MCQIFKFFTSDVGPDTMIKNYRRAPFLISHNFLGSASLPLRFLSFAWYLSTCHKCITLTTMPNTFKLEQFYLLAYNAVYSVESQPTFRMKVSPPSSESKNKRGTAGSACHLLSRWFLPRLIFQPWKWRHVPPKRRLTFHRLYVIISQKTEVFITTVVRTSNPKFKFNVLFTLRPTECRVRDEAPTYSPGIC